MKLINKVPGGTIIIPLLAALLINTFFPELLTIGGPTTALFKEGNSTIMGIFLIICGSQIDMKKAGNTLYKGGILFLLKVLGGIVIGFAVNAIWGPLGVLGLTPFALITGLTNSNSSLYVAMAGEYGNSTDTGGVSILSINDGPFITMLAMGVTGLANIPWQQLVGTIIPLIIGVVWGNLDEEFRTLAVRSQTFVVIWMSFTIGANSNIGTIITAGFQGIWLSVFSILLGIAIMFIYNFFLKKKTPLGILMGTVAANSALTPAIVAQADPSLQPYVDSATAQTATASIITMIAIPILLSYFDGKMKEKYDPSELNPQPFLDDTLEEPLESELTEASR